MIKSSANSEIISSPPKLYARWSHSPDINPLTLSKIACKAVTKILITCTPSPKSPVKRTKMICTKNLQSPDLAHVTPSRVCAQVPFTQLNYRAKGLLIKAMIA